MTFVGALAIAAVGMVLLVGYLTAPAAGRDSARMNATLDGMAAQIGVAGWSSADHVMPIPSPGAPPGYQMPPQMMPGMPTGDDARLSVPVVLRNTTSRGLGFDIKGEFSLRGGQEAQPRTPRTDTFGELDRLGPGSAVNGVLYFDAKPPAANDPPLYLEWERAGHIVQLTVNLNGSAPPGHHNQ